jgi:hypothetical protein
MLYSESRNFCFIHIPKAAGTSVVNFLRELLPDLECVGRHHNGIGDISTIRLENHCPCGLVNPGRTTVPPISLSDTTFLAVLRHPLDIWVSHYHWGVKKLGIYRESRIPGIWNLLFRLSGSRKRAYRDVSMFLEEGKNETVERNNYYKDHLGRSLFDRLTYDGYFPGKLFLIDYQSLDTSLPAFVQEILHTDTGGRKVGHKNKVSYEMNPPACPEHIRKRDSAYFEGIFNQYKYQPRQS